MDRNQMICFTTVVILLFAIQQQQQQLIGLFALYEAWTGDYMALLNAVVLRRRNRRRRYRMRIAPYAWQLPRPVQSWFDIHYNDLTIPDSHFRRLMRMNRNTFNVILNTLGPRLVRQNSIFRDCLPPCKVLALGIYRLAHGNTYVSMAPTFCVGKSTTIEAVQDVVNALFDIRQDHIKWPETLAEVEESISTFDALSSLPNIVGAIDGSHIPIKAPDESAVDYFSRYQEYDFIIQGVANGKKLFIDFACGFPGSMHDARVCRLSNIFSEAEQGNILTQPIVNVNNHNLGPYLVGDSAYPLSPWLIKPYPEGTQDPNEIAFNRELSSARVQVECAFGILKGRWRILQKRLDSKIQFAIKTAVACAVLHNICLRNGDDWDDEYDDDNVPQNPAANVVDDGENARDILKDYIANLP